MTTKTEKPAEKVEAEHHTVASLAKRVEAIEAALKTGDPHSFALAHAEPAAESDKA